MFPNKDFIVPSSEKQKVKVEVVQQQADVMEQ
jgi:hypothetical protein